MTRTQDNHVTIDIWHRGRWRRIIRIMDERWRCTCGMMYAKTRSVVIVLVLVVFVFVLVVVVVVSRTFTVENIRRNRRKTTVIGDNRFRPAWNEMERERVERKRDTSDEKTGKNYSRTCIKMKSSLTNFNDDVTRSSLKTRNSNGSRFPWFRYPRLYFEELELEEEVTRPLTERFFLPFLRSR